MANQYTNPIDWEEVFKTYDPFLYTSKEIASFIGVHPTSVRRNKLKFVKEDKKKWWKKIFNEYPPNVYSCEEIAKTIDKDVSTVCKAIKKYYYIKKRRKKRIVSVKYLKEVKDIVKGV